MSFLWVGGFYLGLQGNNRSKLGDFLLRGSWGSGTMAPKSFVTFFDIFLISELGAITWAWLKLVT